MRCVVDPLQRARFIVLLICLMSFINIGVQRIHMVIIFFSHLFSNLHFCKNLCKYPRTRVLVAKIALGILL